MKARNTVSFIILAIMLCIISCVNNENNKPGTPAGYSSPEGMVLIGKDIITEVITRPDTLGDPWEAEKVKGYDGNRMFKILFERIYNDKLTVYDCLSEEPMKPGDIKRLENEFNSDTGRIAKLQFLEDWYYDPSINGIVKKTKSVSFGYEVIRGGGLPPGYFPLFRVKTE